MVWGAYADALAETGAKKRAADAYEKTIALAREALRLNPRDAAAHSVLGASLARNGRAEEGARAIESALAIDPERATTLADAATVAALRGRAADALPWLKKAVAAGYCPQVLAREPVFGSLHESPEFQTIVAVPRRAAGS
jgi:Flp pilus assembly protein TadD